MVVDQQMDIDRKIDTKEGIGKYVDLVKNTFSELLKKIQGSKGSQVAKKNIQLSINKSGYLISVGILILIWVVLLFFIVKIVFVHSSLNKNIGALQETSSYSLNMLKNSDFVINFPQTLQEVLKTYDESGKIKQDLEDESEFRKSVYTYFLKHLMLPSLNVWQDPYDQTIDLSLIGEKYLDADPYQDIALLTQWSSIIRDSGKGVGINEVMDIKIGDINEQEEGYFTIPMTISFKSDSKRAFLLLVDKISTTSNAVNIGLINEFSYYLFNSIRDHKQQEIESLVKQFFSSGDSLSIDNLASDQQKLYENIAIGRYLYYFIKGNEKTNILIDEQVIDQAIKDSVVCGKDKSNAYCYFMFRNKYRTIPELSYAIGLDTTINKVSALKSFFSALPPLIAIQSFTFDKAKSQGLILTDDTEYIGNITFNVYGQGISEEELTVISTLLHESCFGNDTRFSVDVNGALARVEKALADIGGAENKRDTIEKTANYLQLKDIFTEDVNTFPNLSQYNKVIKKFEYYRMLKDSNLCF